MTALPSSTRRCRGGPDEVRSPAVQKLPPAVASAVFERDRLLIQLFFTPLLASGSIWTGISISTRVSHVRAAPLLSVPASLPPLAIVALMSFNVITPSLGLALGLGVALLLIDGLAWRAVAGVSDRGRLVIGGRD